MATENPLDTVREHGLLVAMERHTTLLWAVVIAVVAVLLHLRLILFAVVLPAAVYLHLNKASNADEASSGSAKPTPAPRPATEPTPAQLAEDLDLMDDDDDLLESDPYENNFWAAQGRSAASGNPQDDPLGGLETQLNSSLGGAQAALAPKVSLERPSRSGVDPSLEELLREPVGNIGGPQLLGSSSNLGFGFEPLGGADFDIGDLDLFGGKRPEKGKGKGKGNRDQKGDDKGGQKGEKGPDPRQVFVGSTGDLTEDEIRDFFERHGEVVRLKVLTQPDGQPKGACFVTFRNVESTNSVLQLRGSELELHGRRLMIKPPHGAKGDGGGKGGGKAGGSDSMSSGKGFRGGGSDEFDHSREVRPTFAVDQDPAGFQELEELLQEALEEENGPLQLSDFDAGAKRFLKELMIRDRRNGTGKSVEAIEGVFKLTRSKARDSVRKWPAYVYTLLQKYDQELYEELREKDAERRRERFRATEDDRGGEGSSSRRFAPPPPSEGRQVTDRWGKPVLLPS
mmetsp:Transcript_16060/g.36855  ORF Transcript_16060/g.36855 Transcript_16060/m.36855 type:complete len:512 (-) Transcript_16060:148-1683(-)